MSSRSRAWVGSLAATLLAVSARGGELFPAWVPPQGEAFLSLDYANTFVQHHYSASGQEFDAGHIRANAIALQAGYSLTDRLALSVGLPYRITKYEGRFPHSPIDDGSYRGTFQDFYIEARYQILRDPLAVTPMVGVTLPSHDYVYFAHAAAGNDLREVPVGVHLGRHLDPILPQAWVQALYMYTFVTPVLGIHHDRSTLDLELGQYVAPALAVRAQALWEHTYGGLDLPSDPSIPAIWPHQITRETSWNVGGGLIYQVGGAVDLTASYFATVSGSNAMKIKQGVAIGATWNFSPARLFRRSDGTQP